MTAFVDVDICNFALGRIGVDRTILALSENSKEARNCRRFYPLCRDEVLERVPWPFAVRVQALAQLPAATLLPGWSYQYATPTDCLTMLEVVPSGEVASVSGYYQNCDGPWAAPRKPAYAFRRALSVDGTLPIVLSSLPDAYGIYVSRVDNTAAYSTLLVSCIADRLGMELAMPMTGDPRWFQVCQQRYQAAFIDSASRQFEQKTDGPAADAPAIRARG
jgi:hypothetical protein